MTLGQADKKVTRLEDQEEQLKWKIEEAKDASVTKYKKLINYKMTLGTDASQFLTKERIKIKRLLRTLHKIKDLSFLDDINEVPTFSDTNTDRKEEGKEVEQEEPLRQSLLT